MNPLNYGSLEACKKLHDAGIVLETEAVWRFPKDKYNPFLTNVEPRRYETDIPAPTLVEVWRELPLDTWLRRYDYNSTKIMNEDNSYFEYNNNPTDAAIYLLIWLKEKGLYEPNK